MKVFKKLVIIAIVLFFGSAIIVGVKDGLTKDTKSTTKETKQEVKKEIKTEEKEKLQKKENKNLMDYKGITSKEIKVNPVWNGSHNKKIGEYATVYYNPNELKDDVLIKFYKDNIENSNYNYFVLRDISNENKGMFFAGCNQIFDYGTLNKEGEINKKEKTGAIEGNKIKYYKK